MPVRGRAAGLRFTPLPVDPLSGLLRRRLAHHPEPRREPEIHPVDCAKMIVSYDIKPGPNASRSAWRASEAAIERVDLRFTPGRMCKVRGSLTFEILQPVVSSFEPKRRHAELAAHQHPFARGDDRTCASQRDGDGRLELVVGQVGPRPGRGRTAAARRRGAARRDRTRRRPDAGRLPVGRRASAGRLERPRPDRGARPGQGRLHYRDGGPARADDARGAPRLRGPRHHVRPPPRQGAGSGPPSPRRSGLRRPHRRR